MLVSAEKVCARGSSLLCNTVQIQSIALKMRADAKRRGGEGVVGGVKGSETVRFLAISGQ